MMRALGACVLTFSLCLPAFAAPKETQKPTLPPQAFGVPIVRQETDYSCGPAALSAILKYFRVFNGTERDLYKLVDTAHEEGTLPENLALGARHFGLSASIEQHMTIERLRTLLAAGKLIILELQAWRTEERAAVAWRDNWDDGHFVVLIGMDAAFAYFMDPSTKEGYTYLPFAELLERWHDINLTRKHPSEQHDIQLGVIIGGPPNHGAPQRPKLHRLLRLD